MGLDSPDGTHGMRDFGTPDSETCFPLPIQGMTDEPRDQRPKLRLTQLSHGSG